MNETSEGSFIAAESVGGVKSCQAPAAQAATAICVQRKGVEKRASAGDAPMIRLQRFRLAEAAAADGNPRKLPEGKTANPAVIRQYQIQCGREGLLEE